MPPTSTCSTNMEPWPPGFACDFDVVFLLSPSTARKTFLRRRDGLSTTHGRHSARECARRRIRLSLVVGGGGRPPQSGVRTAGEGRSATSQLVSTVFCIEAHRGRTGAPPAGLHGQDRFHHAKRKEDGAQAVAAVVVAQSGDGGSIVAGGDGQRRQRPSSGGIGVWGRLGYKP
jgi:hypothetical protein